MERQIVLKLFLFIKKDQIYNFQLDQLLLTVGIEMFIVLKEFSMQVLD